jgi:MraZ protein
MFIGEYNYTIDDKGRLAVPKKFVLKLDGGAVVTRGFDNCLFLYTREEWKALAEKLAALPIGPSNNRAFGRLMLAGAMDVDIDKQGRIILPDYLRKFAGLNKKVVLAGLYNRLEIWDETAWEKYKTTTEASANDIAERMSQLGV